MSQILRLLRSFLGILFGSLGRLFLLRCLRLLGGFSGLLGSLSKLLCCLLEWLYSFSKFLFLLVIRCSLSCLLRGFFQRFLCLLQRLAGVGLRIVGFLHNLRDILLGQFLGGLGYLLG